MGIDTLPEQAWLVAICLVSALGWWSGGRTERLIAVTNITAWLATRLLFNSLEGAGLKLGVLGVDLAFLGVLIVVAVRGDRTWTLFAAAFQLVGVVVHVARLIDHEILLITYLRGLEIWSWLVLTTLGVGAWQYRWSARRSGVDPPPAT